MSDEVEEHIYAGRLHPDEELFIVKLSHLKFRNRCCRCGGECGRAPTYAALIGPRTNEPVGRGVGVQVCPPCQASWLEWFANDTPLETIDEGFIDWLKAGAHGQRPEVP